MLDRVEIMAYDNMGEYNAHAEFATVGGAMAVKDFVKRGYDLSKCDLGLPFYGRTHGGDEAWPSYAQIAGDLENNPFKNTIAKSYMTGVTSVMPYHYPTKTVIVCKSGFIFNHLHTIETCNYISTCVTCHI